MNKQTFREWKKMNTEGTVEQWLNLHTDKRKVTVPKRKSETDKISGLYAYKDRGLVKKK